ncbi:MAG TPA: type II toxin-antitoxin system PemK/MazF family toxin [Candidatus Paceibacterota bacterium]|nr:type II toxin-antitoxin system PemK/MazF family toxin [Candidatus Paceibacterota bacterium]
MEKDFDGWNIQKKKIHSRDKNIFFHEREVWWCSLGVNIGFEQDGKNNLFERPVLILKKFNKHVLWVVPLSTRNKENPYYFPITSAEGSFVILSQLRLISSKRLQRLMYKLPKQQFMQVNERIKKLLEE